MSLQGVNVTVVRLPQVHNAVKQGLITTMITVARQKGVSAYVADGHNRWPAAHVTDVARLYRLALEKGEPARYMQSPKRAYHCGTSPTSLGMA